MTWVCVEFFVDVDALDFVAGSSECNQIFFVQVSVKMGVVVVARANHTVQIFSVSRCDCINAECNFLVLGHPFLISQPHISL